MQIKKYPTAGRMPLPWMWTLLLSLLVYTTVWSLDRLPGGDSGELLAEACVGGVAHPPGYPLLLSLLRIVHWAVKDRESRVHFVYWANAMNSFIAAGAAACVTHTVHLLTSKHSSMEAVAAGLYFAFSKLTWEYARGIEVFALNNLLVGMLHVLMVKHFVQPTTKNVCLGAFVCGLGLANQHTIVLFEVPFILWVLLTHRFRVVEVFMAAMAFLAGVSFYLQTVVSAHFPTPGSWGNTSTFAGLLDHARRKEYGTFQLSPLQGTSEGLLVRLKVYVLDCVEEFHWMGLILMCLGAKTFLFPEKAHNKYQKKSSSWYQRVGYAQISAMVCYLLIFHSLANLPLDSPMPRLGLVVATRGIVAADTNWVKGARCSICLLMVATQYQRNRLVSDDSAGDMIRRHGEAIFSVLPQNAVLLSYTDINWNSLRYLQVCEGARPDVIHLSLQLLPFPWFPRQHVLHPTITFPPVQSDVSTIKNSPGYARLLHDILAANIAQHKDRLFLDLHAVNDNNIASNGQYLGFTLTPHGLVWKVNLPPSTTAEFDNSYSQWRELSLPTVHFAPSLYPAGSWEFASAAIANDACYQGALYSLSYWLDRGKTIQHASEAAKYVLGMHHTSQVLIQVETEAAIADGSWGLTYDAYDLTKNTALATMRFSSGLELMKPLILPLQEQQKSNGANRQEQMDLHELHNLVQHLDEIRQVAINRIKSFLKDMKLRQDPDIKAFQTFIKQDNTKTKKHKTNKNKNKKRYK